MKWNKFIGCHLKLVYTKQKLFFRLFTNQGSALGRCCPTSSQHKTTFLTERLEYWNEGIVHFNALAQIQ